MESPQLETIEIGNKLEKAESDVINGLKLEAFDVDKDPKNNLDALKKTLKDTTINIITSAPDATKKTTEKKNLIDIATQFDQYVEKGEGWKLKVKAWKLDTPEWIKYILENPKNNDLAYLVQKIAELVEYKTAKKYTDDQMKIDTVKDDMVFGNQTRRALTGLKNRIENDVPIAIDDWKTYTWKYIAWSFLEWLVSDKKNDIEKNTALVKYNLQYKDGKIVPLDTYEFMDPNSSNYAVKSKDEVVVPVEDISLKTKITETKINSTDKIGNRIFHFYENQIDESVAKIEWIQLQNNINENPYIYLAESDTWNTIEKININDYIKDGSLDISSLNTHINFIKQRTDNLKKTIETFKNKTYLFTELFGTDKKFQTDAYKTFFNYFKDQIILIDKNKRFTFYLPTKNNEIHYNKIQFDFDEDGIFDHKYCKWLTIDTINDKVINADGTLNEDELKAFIAQKITSIIENPENGYV